MDLDLTDEQQMLGRLVRDLCGSTASLETVRSMEDDPVGYPAEFWKQLGALDLIGLMLPEEYGGSAMSLVEGAVVYQELGRALAPSPHFASAVMSAGLIQRAGTAEQRTDWLPRIRSGDAIVVPAWLEPGNGFGPAGVQTGARHSGNEFVLNGVKWHVPFASSAEALIVLARTDEGVEAFLVDPAAEGVTLSQQFAIGSDTQYQVELVDVSVPASARIGTTTVWDEWADTMLDGIILLAAQAVGGARYTLDITVQYAKDREQFDKPLGAFQAISHYLADAATAVEGATVLVYEAAWARAHGEPAEQRAATAKLIAGQTFRDVTAMAQQVFGGVGFTLEYDVQLYFRRAKQFQLTWYDTRHLHEMIAAAVLDEAV